MPKLTLSCPICTKDLVLLEEFPLGDTTLGRYKCGHVFSKDQIHVDAETLCFDAVDGSGKKLRPYQEDGVKFIIESDFNCIIGDQMRLGKTPQALNAFMNQYKERSPALILVRTANLWQWIREYKVFCSTLPNGIFPILGTTAWIPPGFSAYIISMDTFGAQAKCTCGHRFHEKQCTSKNCECKVYQSNGQGIRDALKKLPFKLVIADEAHSFKNPDSNRSQALVDFMSHLNNGEKDIELKFECSTGHESHTWTEKAKIKFDKRIGHKVAYKSSRCPLCSSYCYIQQQAAEQIVDPEDKACGLVLLTGTAIKNRADEYFIPLNLVNPEKFSSLTRFRNTWLEQDHKGKYSRVKSSKLDSFKQEIAPYVLRREKEDVFTNLPPINRLFTVIEPTKDSYVELYNKQIDKLDIILANKANPSYMDTQHELMEMRRLCGMMKISWVSDYLEASLMDSDNQRYAVGLHHEVVREVLYNSLGGASNCWKFSGKENIDRKNHIQQNYHTMPQRVGILNMLAGGVGCDFHEIDTILILERMWSSADEEQFEFRFYNPDEKIKKRSTNLEYILIKGSFEEKWFDMIEDKRKVFGEVIANHWDLTQDNGTFKDLLERTVGGRL